VAAARTYTVSVVRLRCTPDDFERALVDAGMSAARVRQVLGSIPCTIKTGVEAAVAEQYAEVFRAAGGEVLIEADPTGPEEAAPPAEVAAARPRPKSPFPPPPVPTVNLRPPSAPPDDQLELDPVAPPPPPAGLEIPPIELPPPETAATGPAPIELAEVDEPFQLVSREHGFTADGGGATPARRFPLHAPTTQPGTVIDRRGPEPPLPEPGPVGGDGPELALEVADVDRGPSAHARASQHADRQIAFKVIAPPPPEPWWKRRLPHMITAAILLVIGSYFYGCAKVHGRAIDFRHQFGDDVRAKLRAPGTEFHVWTPGQIEQVVGEVARAHGFSVKSVKVTREEICTRRLALGMGCQVMNNALAVTRLDPSEQLMIANPHACPKPDWILTIEVEAKSRWGLYSYTVDEVTFQTLSSYSLTDPPEDDGRCSMEVGEDPPMPFGDGPPPGLPPGFGD